MTFEEIEEMVGPTLRELCAEYKRLRAQEVEAVARKKEVTEEIVSIITAFNLKSYSYDEWKVTRVDRGSKWRLSEEALIDNGVPIETIQASKIQDPPVAGASISAAKTRPYAPEVVFDASQPIGDNEE
jgi:hypothetical protein